MSHIFIIKIRREGPVAVETDVFPRVWKGQLYIFDRPLKLLTNYIKTDRKYGYSALC